MTITAHTLLVAVALIAFALATVGVPTRINAIALGLLCWLASTIW